MSHPFTSDSSDSTHQVHERLPVLHGRIHHGVEVLHRVVQGDARVGGGHGESAIFY